MRSFFKAWALFLTQSLSFVCSLLSLSHDLSPGWRAFISCITAAQLILLVPSFSITYFFTAPSCERTTIRLKQMSCVSEEFALLPRVFVALLWRWVTLPLSCAVVPLSGAWDTWVSSSSPTMSGSKHKHSACSCGGALFWLLPPFFAQEAVLLRFFGGVPTSSLLRLSLRSREGVGLFTASLIHSPHGKVSMIVIEIFKKFFHMTFYVIFSSLHP